MFNQKENKSTVPIAPKIILPQKNKSQSKKNILKFFFIKAFYHKINFTKIRRKEKNLISNSFLNSNYFFKIPKEDLEKIFTKKDSEKNKNLKEEQIANKQKIRLINFLDVYKSSCLS